MATPTVGTTTTHIMKLKRKRKIPEISLLIAAIWINSFWPWPGGGSGGNGGDAGGRIGFTPLPLAYCSHMPASVGVAAYTVDAAHMHNSDMHSHHNYDDGGGGGGGMDGGGSSASLENMAMHGMGHDGGGMPEESEERDHIAHHFVLSL
ncbi:unnamed protein product [Ceratitis capitata]|uniref:(Mediterranean fruit fly) hypothetical protein n=1 Tax=Ceratitis capitata TaxID=7213 RepID=A0A811ULN9_CERCA|nr:unnamed protein product [Ceratitis capitata]